jgi:Sigma-70, region 4
MEGTYPLTFCLLASILRRYYRVKHRLEVLCVVDLEQIHCTSLERDEAAFISRRRLAFAHLHTTLPEYGTIAYWQMIEVEDAEDVQSALPLEVLVLSLRTAIERRDVEGRNRIMTQIIRRTQKYNTYWASNALNALHIPAGERREVARDIFADLYERIMRALIDPERAFWEENFQHCLRFERMHVFQAFLMREGWWKHQSERIPRNLLESLDAAPQSTSGERCGITIEDEQTQKDFLAVELSHVPLLLLHVPESLQSVLVLLFWEGRTEKEVASLLNITDRTVRNRLRRALQLLQGKLAKEREGMYG